MEFDNNMEIKVSIGWPDWKGAIKRIVRIKGEVLEDIISERLRWCTNWQVVVEVSNPGSMAKNANPYGNFRVILALKMHQKSTNDLSTKHFNIHLEWF